MPTGKTCFNHRENLLSSQGSCSECSHCKEPVFKTVGSLHVSCSTLYKIVAIDGIIRKFWTSNSKIVKTLKYSNTRLSLFVMQRDDPVADDNTQCDEIISEDAFFFVDCIFIFIRYKAVCCQYNAIVSLMSLFANNFTCLYTVNINM